MNARVAMVVMLVMLLSGSFARADPPRGMTPEVAAIMDKLKAGKSPTPEEAETLRQWQQGILKASSNPAAKPGIVPDGIPGRVTIGETYTIKSASGARTFELSATADVMVFPQLGGDGDYFLHGPAGTSSFRIEPIGLRGTHDGYVPGQRLEQGGGISATGGGSIKLVDVGAGSAQGTLHDTAFTALIVTTGHGDQLFANGKLEGVVDGTRTYTDQNGHHTDAIHGRDDFYKYLEVDRIEWPFSDENDRVPVPGKPAPTPAMQLSLAAFTKAVSSSTTETIKGAESFSLANGARGQSTFELTLRPPKVELAIQPVDETAYEAWLPLPDVAEGGDKQLFGDPKPFALRIAVHDTSKDGEAKGTARVPANAPTPCDIEVTFDNVSKHDGVAMNFPARTGPGDGKPDLFFPQKGQPKGAVIPADGQKLLVENTREIVILVAARDAGAYGNIVASCRALGITSRNPRTGESALAMPMDDNKNQIADEWEKMFGIYDRSLPPSWDDEDVPKMQVKGDGLTLFEEYRGVIDEVNGKEQFDRLDPRHMKLFLWLDGKGPDVALWRKGAQMYQQATKIEVRFIHDASRLKPLGAVNHWLNFQATKFTVAKQCAVIVRDDGTTNGPPGNTPPIAGHDELAPFTPATTDHVNVSRGSTHAQVVRWMGFFPNNLPPGAHVGTTFQAGAAAAGVNLNDYTKQQLQDPISIDARTNLAIAFVTLHELGHATGGQHHGLAGLGKLYDQFKTDNGIYPNDVPAGASADLTAKQAAYYDAQDLAWGGGTHSCPMRYWDEGEVKTDLVKFLVMRWNLQTPADGGEWKFCDADWPHMRIKPE